MHGNSYTRVKDFSDRYMDREKTYTIYDIGSLDVNGTYKTIFNIPGWSYSGFDLSGGKNVDIIMKSPYNLGVLPGSCDVIISGQTFEHVEYPWLLMEEIYRALKPGGLACIVAPSFWVSEHRYPVDCYRYMRDGMRALCKWVDLKVMELHFDEGSTWGDITVIAKKYGELEKKKEDTFKVNMI